MIKYIIISILFSSLISFAQDFFEAIKVNTLEINFEQTKWDSILHEYWKDAEDERLTGSIIINDEEIDSVGVRFKGFSSYRILSDKKPLNIKLDHIINQDYQGISTFKLSNVYRDPSFLREVLGYEIARKYMPSSKANYINVYINDEFYGLYINVETIDKSFIKKHFFENNGVFIKGAPQRSKGGHALMGEANLKYLGTDISKYDLPYDLKSDNGWHDLIELCDILNNDVTNLHTVFNIDRALWLLAFHNVLVSLDSPLNAPRNFYLYKDINGKFNILPWDLNMTFATYGLLDGTWDHTIEDYQKLNPFFNLDSEKYPLVSKMLTNSFYKREYIAHMKTILHENFMNGWYYNRGIELQSLIDEYVSADTGKEFTYDDFFNNLNVTVENEVHTIYGIEELMNGRIEYLNNHEAFKVIAPIISEVSHSPSIVSSGTDVIITAKLNNENIVKLGFRTSHIEEFNRIEMFDDGTNGDSNANDGIYSITLTSVSSDVQYYIYSDNYQAAAFSPEGAENKYHLIGVNKDLVINEFMASNDTAVQDKFGEYDDWIEIFNNSNNPISLEGYYLSDNASNMTKWSFPDTVIEGKSYLTIWADEDSSQGRLHANFKLSSSGEVILLINPPGEIIDEISFGIQTTDISMGRYPNATGEFGFMESTFGTENGQLLTNISDNSEHINNTFSLGQNYPNPFNSSTTIKYTLPAGRQEINGSDFSLSNVILIVYDILGREIATLVNEIQSPGQYEIIWDTNDHSSGLYFYALKTNEHVVTKKMILLK